MKKFSFIVILLFSVFVNHSVAQKSETTTTTDTSKAKKHSPMAASIMSAVIPGLGQVYNKKYWKVPIIYSGLLTAGYFLKINRDAYLDLKNAYIAETDSDATTINNINLSESGLKTYMELYQTRMEICYIAMGLLYVLNIVDASVDAHLFTFDVSDNLSLQMSPDIHHILPKMPYAGIKLTVNLQ